MSDATYPRRPKFFAVQFARLMGKVCLGGEIGPEACWLLAYIASTEDAAGYRRAITFYSEDLATRCGMSLSSMKRARERAVAAGWLAYTPGAKRRPARYYVTIPAWANGHDDAPGDEGGAGILGQSDPECGPESEQGSGILGQIGPECGQKADSMRTAFLPIPIPNTSPSESGTADAVPAAPGKSQSDPAKTKTTEPKSAGKLPSGLLRAAIDTFCGLRREKYGAKYPFDGGKDAKLIEWMVNQVDRDIAKFTEVVKRYLADTDPFVEKTQHSLGLLRKQFVTWMTSGPTAPKSYRPTPTANAAVERAMRGDVAPPMILTPSAANRQTTESASA